MGGKKGPEKNRKYEKDRRDRFNDQFVELHKLLPDFSSASAKATKSEVISKTIQYLKESHTQTRKLEIEFENEKRKVNDLQKKVNGVLQIVKELIKSLHKSNIKFPSSLPINDFKIFQDEFSKNKNKSISVSAEENKINDGDSDCAAFTDSESEEKSTSSNLPADAPPKRQSLETVSAANNVVPCTSIQTNTNSPDASSAETKVVNVNSDAFIVPTGNFFAVNGAANNILNCYNSTPPLLLNRPFAMPTLILMQNNFVPVNAVQHIAVTQQSQKLLLPKQTINTTKTTFINKKPIPSVRLYKATSAGNNGVRKAGTPRRRHSRRSKGILVKYPKRKPPAKNKKRELHSKKCTKPSEEVGKSENTQKDNTFTASGASFADTSMSKTYQCADRMLNIPEIPTTGQFIDFLENTASRCMESAASNSEFEQSNELLKGEKAQMTFVANTFEPAFSNTDLSCALIEPHKKDGKTTEAGQPKLYETPSTSDLYLAGAEKNFTESTAVAENVAMEKPKSLGKEIRSKELNLSFDDKKHYEGFDEFSNDLFTSLQVPPSGHNADSISPTAAFLQTFPLVSSGANVDLLPEHEESTTTASATILQIGNLESPSMLFAGKGNREAKEAAESFVYTSALENAPKDKKCKDATQPVLNFDATFNTKAPCKESQFYPSTTTTFSSYNIFTKYNDFPPPATSYYSLCSQPFTSKTTDSDFSWMSYTPDEAKDKSKHDKCVSTFKTIPEVESFAEAPSKSKKAKQSNARPLVNWMTTPDLRNADVSDGYLPKEDTSMYGCNSSNNYNYSSGEYFVENQNYSESSCKLAYPPSNPCNSWSSKATNVHIPSTLPTLVGDLALGNTFNSYESTKKFEPEKKKACRNYCKGVNTPSSFLSVTQLVDDKSVEKTKKMEMPCGFGDEQEKWNQRSNEEYPKKTYVAKDTKMKCKKDAIKYQAPRCASKENKKYTRNYSMQNCQMQKEVNPLSSKNSNYSAESLISSSNQNCSTGYFPYENSSNYSCSNEYAKKRGDEGDSLANVGYYGNSNYMYHNNFQSFNNYGFGNQCYNNYSSQIQTSGFQKKKDDGCTARADTEWSLPSYNPIVQSDYGGNQKVDAKCKQSFPNKYNHAQKNNVGSEMYNKYLQASPATSTAIQSKSNCTFNSSCSFNQTAGQACMETNYLAPNCEMKSNRQGNGMNTVHSATTLTNFNLSTIFPEINDKHCSTNQVNATNTAKNDPKYSKNNVDETNYNYFLQPAAENNTDHFYGSSSFQIHNFTDFTSRKALK